MRGKAVVFVLGCTDRNTKLVILVSSATNECAAKVDLSKVFIPLDLIPS